MKADIDITKRYDHPIDRVWQALTSRDALTACLMPNDFAPEAGRRFTFTTNPAPGFDGRVHCQVLKIEAPLHMVWAWKGGPIDTTLTFTLTPLNGRRATQLRLRQVGFHGLSGRLTRMILAPGFAKQLSRSLPAYLAGRSSDRSG